MIEYTKQHTEAKTGLQCSRWNTMGGSESSDRTMNNDKIAPVRLLSRRGASRKRSKMNENKMKIFEPTKSQKGADLLGSLKMILAHLRGSMRMPYLIMFSKAIRVLDKT